MRGCLSASGVAFLESYSKCRGTSSPPVSVDETKVTNTLQSPSCWNALRRISLPTHTSTYPGRPTFRTRCIAQLLLCKPIPNYFHLSFIRASHLCQKLTVRITYALAGNKLMVRGVFHVLKDAPASSDLIMPASHRPRAFK